ncbi:MAG: flagellar hook-associated protein FlgK [Myxococcota bacterium]
MFRSSLNSALNVAANSLQAASGGTAVVGENITGANDARYVRRSVRLETNPLGGAQAGGVRWTGTARAFDVFAFANLVGETASRAAAEARAGALVEAEGALAPVSDATLAVAFDDFFAAFDRLGQTPDDPTARATVLSSADQVAARFVEAANGLNSQRGTLFVEAQAVAREVDDRLAQIARLNSRIAARPDATSGRAELMDQRDALVREVADRIDVSVLSDDDGQVTLLSGGTALLEGGRAARLTVSLDPAQAMTVAVVRGATTVDITGRLSGGRLAGLQEARDLDVASLQTQLDQLAFDFADAVNTAHQGGVDLNGVAGDDFFTDPTGLPFLGADGAAAAFTVRPGLRADPDAIAAATATAPPPGGNDTALAISALATQGLASGRTPGEAFGDLAGDIGRRRVEADADLRLREGTVAFALAEQQKSSGVSLEEELVELSRFQRAFEASTRVLQTIDELMDEVIRSIG